jgi:predicted secreted acid phosphatase
MSIIDVFLEFLKFIFVGFEIVRYLLNRKKEKELALTVEKLSQHLFELENSSKEKSLNE